MPAGVVLAMPFHRDAPQSAPDLVELLQGLLHLVGRADDAHEIVHALLQLGLQRVGVLRFLPVTRRVERGQRGPRGHRDVHFGHRRSFGE